MAKIDAFFELLNKQGGSDLHLISGLAPAIRVHGKMERVNYEVLTNNSLRALIYEITPEEKIKVFEETGDVDYAYEVPGLARYRGNLFMQRNGIGAVFREIPSKILTIDQLRMPSVLKKLATLHKGLVLVTGPTGSGKSTTLAAIIDEANKIRQDHIITIEDPIEFVHESKGCIVNHREVGTHTESFSKALRASLREDPDIILVGEMRDLETISLALEAAATGHLVFGTLHTQSASKTVDRVIDVFPADQQAQIRTTLSESLKAVIAQTLFRKANQMGRVAVLEILMCTYAVGNLIRESKTFQLPSVIQTGKQLGMQSMDDGIMDLLTKRIIGPDEAYQKAFDKQKFVSFLRKAPDVLI
ncbi:MAG: type IV pilus twitching motility protein PilT [bacterium]